MALHRAARYSFAELVVGLHGELATGNIKRTQQCELSLYTYTTKCVMERAWSDFSRVARGLILDETDEHIVALPFEKFFNYGEFEAVPNEPFTAYEKLDGSLGIVYEYKGEWQVATKGSFDSEQAIWATEWLRNHIDLSKLEPELTYLTEIIYPDNRIVVDYRGLEALAFLSSYHRRDFREYTEPPEAAGFAAAKVQAYESVKDLLAAAETLSANHEGFVLRFDSGLRLKIKGDEYARVHRLISEVTPLGVWRVMLAGDDLAALRGQIPEEYWRDLDSIVSLLEGNLQQFVSELEDALAKTAGLDDKNLGLLLKEGGGKLNETQRAFIFAARKQNLLQALKTPGPLREKVFKTFRPTGNQLTGYRSSSAVNRFGEAS